MRKIAINTFEGGLDQDTDRKLVSNNNYFSLTNGTLTKDGKEGVLTTFKGFSTMGGGINIDQPDTGLFIYVMEWDTGATLLAGSNIFFRNPNGGGSFAVTNTNTISTIGDLYNELKVNYTTGKVYRNSTQVFVFATNETLSGLTAGINLIDTLGSNASLTNLGLKEIAYKDNKRLLILFRRDFNGLFIIQFVYYDDSTDIVEYSGNIYKADIPSSRINSDNIIYNKEFQNKHTIYWCDGVNPDKSLVINKSIDPDDYADFDTMLDEIRDDVYFQSDNFFNEQTANYFPRPEIYDLELNTSGKLKPTEILMFFYRLKIGDKFSNISTYTDPIYIPTNDITKDPSEPYIDDLKFVRDNVNKWVARFKIDGLVGLNYEFIEPYVIHYNFDSNFKVRKLDDIPVGTVESVITYNEDYDTSAFPEANLDTLFNLSTTENVSKEQIIFKNRRIKANLKDTSLDVLINFDARAYRFDSLRMARLYSSDGELEASISGLVPDYDIEEELDLVNKYNDEYTDFNDWSTNQQYKFKADGVTEGGEGPNISYTFTDDKVGEHILGANPLADEKGKRVTSNFNITLPSGKPVDNSHRTPVAKKGFTGGEVYRFFIFFWKEDVPTVAKWIGDIKFPENTGIVDNVSSIYSKGIEFDIDTSSLTGEVTAVSIGYAPRDYADKTVLMTTSDIGTYYAGEELFANPTFSYAKLGLSLNINKPTSDNLLNMASLDTTLYNSFSQNKKDDVAELSKFLCFPFDLVTNDIITSYSEFNQFHIKKLAHCSYNRFTADFEYDSNLNGSANSGIDDSENLIEINNSTAYVAPELISVDRLIGLESQDLSVESEEEIPGSSPVNYVPYNSIDLNEIFPSLNEARTAFTNGSYYTTIRLVSPQYGIYPKPRDNRGSDDVDYTYPKSFVVLDNAFNSLQNDAFSILSLRKEVTNQYGGDSFAARSQNEVEMLSYTKLSDEASLTVSPQGDTYTTYPDFIINHSASAGADVTGGDDGYDNRGIFMPLECTTNIHARGSRTAQDPNDSNSKDIYGKRWLDVVTYNEEILDSNDNIYNDAFVINNDLDINEANISNTTLPIQETTNSEFNSKIIISQRKILGEGNDSWLDFRVNDSKIIDPVWGEINKLIDDRDALYVMQENAIARQYVEQLQQNVNDVSQLILGTGAVAGQHVYVFKNLGVTSPDDVIQLVDDIIFRDLIRKKIYTLKTGEVKGLSQALIDDDRISDTTIRAIIYDRQSNIVFIPNYKDYQVSGTSNFIVYDNNVKKITSDATFKADEASQLRFTGLTNLLSLDNANLKVFNKDNYDIYSGVTTGFSITFFVNPESNRVKVFDNLLLDYEVISYDINGAFDIYDQKPASIFLETEHQTGGGNILSTTNIKRRGRYWHYQIPRMSPTNLNDPSIPNVTTARARGHWLKVTIVFDRFADKEIKMNNVITYYRPSNLN